MKRSSSFGDNPLPSNQGARRRPAINPSHFNPANFNRQPQANFSQHATILPTPPIFSEIPSSGHNMSGFETSDQSGEDFDHGEYGSDDGTDSDDENVEESSSEDDSEVEEGEEEEEEGKDRNEELKNSEMEELEKEYMELQHKEQDLLGNLKRHKDEDLLKGQAVKNQKALWDKALELRFLLQKAFSNSNRLLQEPNRALFLDSDKGVIDAYSDLISTTKKTLDSMLELQEALIEKNPAIAQSSDDKSVKTSNLEKASANLNTQYDTEWQQISQLQSRMSSFRDKSIDKWQRKTQVTSGNAAIRGKLQAFNQNISEQVAAYMREPSKMIKGMQQKRSAIALLGNVPDSDEINKVSNTDDDPELLDDSEFYQQLLREFFESVDISVAEKEFYDRKRSHIKKRKVVDRRASKSRKIRYNVHEKIVNFMAPQPVDLPPMAPKLFENLFGRKTQRPSTVL